jgi:hypothetical protein
MGKRGGRISPQTEWKKGQSGNPNGRPKNIHTILNDYFLAECNLKLSKSQTSDIIQVILGKTKNELIELAKNDELPFWISLIVKKAQRDYEKGSIHILDVLFDRVYGKPTETLNQTIVEQPIFEPIDLDVQEDNSTT